MGKFNIGDKVRWHNGTEGTIVAPCKYYPNCWNIGVEGYNSCFEDYLTLIEKKGTFIIIRRDDWFGLEIVFDCYNKPKQFRTEDEAIAYINETEVNPSDAEVISVHI